MAQLRDMHFRPIVLQLWHAMEGLGLNTTWPDPRPVYPVNPMRDGLKALWRHEQDVRDWRRRQGLAAYPRPGG